jgi:hypothetical protein
MKCFANEKRVFRRSRTLLDGTLFMRGTSTTVACWVLDVSAGGARVSCQTPLRIKTLVVLYIEGVGRFEGVTNRWSNGFVGVRFTCGEAKRERLIERLNRLTAGEAPKITSKQMHERMPPLAARYIVCKSGQNVSCEVVDISLQGVSLETAARPAIGETVRLGNTFGRVVRHLASGIAITFVSHTEVDERPAGRDVMNESREPVIGLAE